MRSPRGRGEFKHLLGLLEALEPTHPTQDNGNVLGTPCRSFHTTLMQVLMGWKKQFLICQWSAVKRKGLKSTTSPSQVQVLQLSHSSSLDASRKVCSDKSQRSLTPSHHLQSPVRSLSKMSLQSCTEEGVSPHRSPSLYVLCFFCCRA